MLNEKTGNIMEDFSINRALTEIKQYIEDGNALGQYGADLSIYILDNEDYSHLDVEKYGVFEAIYQVVNYEQCSFGEVYTAIEKGEIINALFSLVVNKVMNEFYIFSNDFSKRNNGEDYWNGYIDERAIELLLTDIDEKLKNKFNDVNQYDDLF